MPLLKAVDELDQAIDIVIVIGDFLAAAEVDPFHPWKIFAELCLDDVDCLPQVLERLVEKDVEVQSADAIERIPIFCKRLLELAGADAEARSGSAWAP